MAVSIANQSLLASPPACLSVSSSFSKALEPNSKNLFTLHRRSPTSFKSIISGFPLANSFPIINNNNCVRRPSFKAYLATQDSESTTNGEEKASQNEANHKNALSLKNLIKIYREAILYGDKKTVSEIEATISIIENKNNELIQKVSNLSAEITTGKEKYIRLQADFDNFRKRSEKERLNIRSDAQGEVIESLLPMVDSFERAKQQLKPETEMEKKIDASYQGIYKQFVEIMKNLQVTAVPTVGKPFDPALHEAIAREESHEYNEGIVIQDFRRGFLLGNRLLRPAMVKVSAGPGSKKPPVDGEMLSGQPATTAGIDER